MKAKYQDIRFQAKTLAVIDQANAILNEYDAQGFTMTLRQVYYQFVARGLSENTLNDYKRIGRIINTGRLGGLIDWDHIEDRTRSLKTHPSWRSPEDIVDAIAEQYREDLWEGQKYRPEVWIEKTALIGVIEEVCNEYRVPYFACIGNNSQSEQRKAGRRFADHIEDGLIPLVLHLGDHDPNGLDMTRDNRERLSMFAGTDIEVRRIALNMDQVRRYNPPPNFGKETDKHYPAYIKQYGRECWELDALSPTVIAELIRAELEQMIDWPLWQERTAAEQRNRDLLGIVAENWPRVENILSTDDDPVKSAADRAEARSRS
jgi:hypothetical protein